MLDLGGWQTLTAIFDCDLIQIGGLGLSISHSIIESFGGTITVESEYGGGSTFTVRVPMDQRLRPARKSSPKPGSSLTLRGKALVVDDEAEIRAILSDMLPAIGLTVKVASDGVVGLEMLQAAPFDYVFVDVKMPRMGGAELLTEARKLPHLAHTKFLVITGGIIADEEKDRQEVIRNLAHAILFKPFNIRQISDSLQSFT